MKGFNWKRVAAFAALIYATAWLVGFASTLTTMMGIYGDTLEASLGPARLVRGIAYFLACIVLYWRLAAGVTARRWLHVAAAFVLVQLIDAAFTFVFFSTPPAQWLNPWSLLRGALAAALGLGVATLSRAGTRKTA